MLNNAEDRPDSSQQDSSGSSNSSTQPGEPQSGGLNPDSLGPTEAGLEQAPGSAPGADPSASLEDSGTSGDSSAQGGENSAANDLAEEDDLTADADATDATEADDGDDGDDESDGEYGAVEEKDAIDLLMEDHERVKALFEQFEADKEDDRDGLEDLVAEICLELTIHTQIEEEIFYPAVRAAIEDDDLLDEALVEHAGAKSLISELLDMTSDEDLYDAKVTVLRESIEHHVEEEESEMFPKVRRSDLDTEALGAEMAARKMEFVRELTQTT